MHRQTKKTAIDQCLRFVVVSLLTLGLVSCNGSDDPAKRPVTFSEYTDDLCAGYRTDNRYDAIPPLALPNYLEPYTDPTFGAQVTRITQAAIGEVIKPLYSTVQSWNADESRMILYHTGGKEPGHYLYDGKSYEPLRHLNISTGAIEDVFWHHTDPNRFFFLSAYFTNYGSLMSYNIVTNTSTVVADFLDNCDEGQLTKAGNSVSMQSLDDNSFGLRCDFNGKTMALVYHVDTARAFSLSIGDGTKFEKWYAPNISPNGRFAFLNGFVLDFALKTQLNELDLFEFHSHSSLGTQANGRDALFTTAFDYSPDGCDEAGDDGNGALIVHDLESGECRSIVSPANGYGDPVSGTHVSAIATRKPGWVAMSSIGYDKLQLLRNGKPAPVFWSEIYLVNTENTKIEACRLAHHRSHGKDGKTGYLAEPHVSFSPSGTRLLFGSDWHDSGFVNTFVIELDNDK